MRASCWINMIPAAGIVLVPEGSSSCPCAYNYKTSLALVPATRHNHWGLYGGLKRGKNVRVTELRVNFGAPGDRPDAEGNVWFAFPRPSTAGPRGAGGMGRVPYDDLPVEVLSGENDLTVVARNPDWTSIEGTDEPWLHACGLAGLLSLRIRLGPEGTAPRPYRVTLSFCDPGPSARTGPFDVKLQGETVWSDLDVRKQAGGSNRPLVKETVAKIGRSLSFEIVPKGDAVPVVNSIQLRKEI